MGARPGSHRGLMFETSRDGRLAGATAAADRHSSTGLLLPVRRLRPPPHARRGTSNINFSAIDRPAAGSVDPMLTLLLALAGERPDLHAGAGARRGAVHPDLWVRVRAYGRLTPLLPR